MSFIAAAVIAGGATLVGGYIASQGAQNAAQTQANAAQNAQNISLGEFNTITGQQQPYMQAGYGALNALNYGLGLGGAGTPTPGGGSVSGGGTVNNHGYAGGGAPGMSNVNQGMAPGGVQTPGTQGPSGTGLGYGSLLAPFTTDTFKQYSPAYQFQLQQGQQGVLNSDSSGQGALSGAALKDLTGYNQGLANTSFNNAFNQYQTQQGNIYSRLSNIANLGQNAAANTGQAGTALAGQAAQSATNIGTALGAGQVGSANAWSGAVSNLGGLYAAYGGGGGGGTVDPWSNGTYSANLNPTSPSGNYWGGPG